MSAPEGNSKFCFPESASLDVFWDEVEGNIETRGKTKLTVSRGNRHYVLCYTSKEWTIFKQTNKQTGEQTTARFSTTLFLLNTANIRQMHRRRKQRTDLLSTHFRNPTSLNGFWLRFSNKSWKRRFQPQTVPLCLKNFRRTSDQFPGIAEKWASKHHATIMPPALLMFWSRLIRCFSWSLITFTSMYPGRDTFDDRSGYIEI